MCGRDCLNFAIPWLFMKHRIADLRGLVAEKERERERRFRVCTEPHIRRAILANSGGRTMPAPLLFCSFHLSTSPRSQTVSSRGPKEPWGTNRSMIQHKRTPPPRQGLSPTYSNLDLCSSMKPARLPRMQIARAATKYRSPCAKGEPTDHVYNDVRNYLGKKNVR